MNTSNSPMDNMDNPAKPPESTELPYYGLFGSAKKLLGVDKQHAEHFHNMIAHTEFTKFTKPTKPTGSTGTTVTTVTTGTGESTSAAESLETGTWKVALPPQKKRRRVKNANIFNEDFDTFITDDSVGFSLDQLAEVSFNPTVISTQDSADFLAETPGSDKEIPSYENDVIAVPLASTIITDRIALVILLIATCAALLGIFILPAAYVGSLDITLALSITVAIALLSITGAVMAVIGLFHYRPLPTDKNR